MERKLELKDICGYLPYGLKGQVDGVPYSIIGIETDTRLVKTYLYDNKYNDDYWNLSVFKIILRPISDLYKTIIHNGKEIVPIVELAEMTFPNNRNHTWIFNEKSRQAFSNYYGNFYFEDCSFHIEDGGNVFNQVQLFDYLHELKIDYRGLINAGLAVDVNTLNENPYK